MLSAEMLLHKIRYGVPVVAQWLTNLTRNHEVAGSIPGLTQWVKDPELLWLWCRPAAIAPIRPLAWEPPYAAGRALEMAKRQKKKENHSPPPGALRRALSPGWARPQDVQASKDKIKT